MAVTVSHWNGLLRRQEWVVCWGSRVLFSGRGLTQAEALERQEIIHSIVEGGR